MRNAQAGSLLGPLILLLWAGYLLFGAYWQFARSEAFGGFMPVLLLMAGVLPGDMLVPACSVLAAVLGLCCLGFGVWAACSLGADAAERREP